MLRWKKIIYFWTFFDVLYAFLNTVFEVPLAVVNAKNETHIELKRNSVTKINRDNIQKVREERADAEKIDLESDYDVEEEVIRPINFFFWVRVTKSVR